MQARKVRLSLISLLVLVNPKWITAQDGLRDTAIQHSIKRLLATATPSTPSPRASPSRRLGDRSPVSTHEKFATFLAGEDFTSSLLLENFRPDRPITFHPTLILSGGEVPLDSVTVPAHSSATVDISAALMDRSLTDTCGTVSVRFDFASYGPGNAVVQMRDDKHHIFLNSYAQSPEEYWSGTGYDAVVWAPHEGTQGFISITNASSETRTVRVAFLAKGQSEQQPDIQIPARQTRIVAIDDLLAENRKTGAGIHIEYGEGSNEQYLGAILVEGQLFNKRTGFAKNIHFMDKALPPTGTLRTHFLMLGGQPVQDNFPTDVSFRSVAAVRNLDSVPVMVTPTVKFLRNDALQTVSLVPRYLKPAQSILIDFNDEQRAGHLPPDFRQGSLELTPDTGHVSIVGELFNFSQSGGYVVGPSFSSYPNRSTASIWRTDGSFQTTIMIENTANENDRVTLNLYSEDGQYSKTFDVSAGRLLKINVRELQQNGIPDDKGNLLLGSSGVMSLVGNHNARSKLSYDKIVHTTDQSDYVGLPANPCDFVMSIDLFLDLSSGSQPFPVMKEYDWSISGPQDEASINDSISSDSSLVQISSGVSGDMVTFKAPTDGATHTVTINPALSPEGVTNCDACSAGQLPVIPVDIKLFLTDTFWKTPSFNADGSCSYQNLACNPGTTPTCTPKKWSINDGTDVCAAYAHTESLLVTVVLNIIKICLEPPFLAEDAQGPGNCN